MKKNRVINGIKSSREIKETRSSDLFSHGLDDAVMNKKKHGFCGMVDCKKIEEFKR